MITHVDIALLPEDLRELVLAKYRVALMEPSHRMSMAEAAWLYGYTYQHVRLMVAKRKLRSTGSGLRRRISHAAMRQYRMRRQPGHKTKKERMAQQRLG